MTYPSESSLLWLVPSALRGFFLTLPFSWNHSGETYDLPKRELPFLASAAALRGLYFAISRSILHCMEPWSSSEELLTYPSQSSEMKTKKDNNSSSGRKKERRRKNSLLYTLLSSSFLFFFEP